jgi:periplasmic divalent cation tolerance protein
VSHAGDAGESAAGSADGSDVVAVLMTAPDVATAELIAREVVAERLAACCTILPGSRSFYRWEGAIEQADEIVVILKTTVAAFDALRERIVALHPYDVPEIIALAVTAGAEPYLTWVRESVNAHR